MSGRKIVHPKSRRTFTTHLIDTLIARKADSVSWNKKHTFLNLVGSSIIALKSEHYDPSHIYQLKVYIINAERTF